MHAEAGAPAPFLLAARVGGEVAARWLCLDAGAPSRWQELDDRHWPPPEAAGALLVTDGLDPAVEELPGGGLLVNRALLWSLLDPVQAARGLRLAAEDPLAAERALRSEARRLWDRLQWWGRLGPDLRRECRSLVAAFSRPAGRLLAHLDAWAERSDGHPFAGWSAGEERATESQADAGGASESVIPPIVWEGELAPDALAAWLVDPAGLGALYGKSFAPRTEQAEMAEEVARCLAAGRPLLVEAGTGVGKTLAYLVPLLAEVRRRGARAVVATHTRALQVQILEHDLPLLAPLFPDLQARLLMGRRNYLCRRRRLRFLARRPESLADGLAAAAFRLWLAATEEGQREELAGHPLLQDELTELFDSPEPCSPSVCYENDGCHVQRARRRAREAELLVVNHSLLMHDLRADHTLVGPYELLVVDEAHRLPQVALETHAIRCDRQRLSVVEELIGEVRVEGGAPHLIRELGKAMNRHARTGAAVAESLNELAGTMVRCFQAYRAWWGALGSMVDARLPEGARPPGRQRIPDADEGFGPVRAETERLLAAAAVASGAYVTVEQRVEMLPELPAGTQERLATLAQVGQLLVALQQDVKFLTSGWSEEWVAWIEPGSGPGLLAVGATLLEAGDLLREYWLGAGLRPIMTSATLAVGEDFSHMLGELGLRRMQPPTTTTLVASPFDYEQQARFLTLADLPPPDHAEFADTTADLVHDLVHRARRKTLVLFTSYQALQRVAARLMAAEGEEAEGLFAGLAGPPPEILLQQPAGETTELLERFRRSHRAVLLGTTTFWEGVDFPGEDLEVLVVTKLPFQVPNDPWVEARCERLQAAGENPFTAFMVRDAVLRLRQGLGRLIRRGDDRGVVVLLDSRLYTKSYGATFLSALPTAPRVCRDPTDLVDRAVAFFAGEEGSAP
jgi:Rad3-related DNA helicase